MDFERNFRLPFTRVPLLNKSWTLVDLFGDDSIAGKPYKNIFEMVIYNLRS